MTFHNLRPEDLSPRPVTPEDMATVLRHIADLQRRLDDAEERAARFRGDAFIPETDEDADFLTWRELAESLERRRKAYERQDSDLRDRCAALDVEVVKLKRKVKDLSFDLALERQNAAAKGLDS